jgi:thymidylate kinase
MGFPEISHDVQVVELIKQQRCAMKKAMISFMGLDGSGKSTCIDYVYDELKKRGTKVKIVRAAYVIKVMSVPIKLAKKLLMKKDSNPFGGDYKAYLNNMRKQANKGGVYRFYSFLTTLEFKAQIFFKIHMNRSFGYTLLVDRYIYDNAVTYAANLGLEREYIEKVMSGKWKRSPKPDLIIYIKTPVDICFARKDDTPDPLYLEIREPLYDLVAEMYKSVTISGSQNKNNMTTEVMEAVDSVINRK